MFLTGAGGTGKSEVVKALREFAQRWGIADTLCVTATTGIAACIIHGMTWHKATGHFSFLRGGKANELRPMWQKISTLVLDEVSMKSARNLYNLDQWLRSLKNKPDRVFGGVHLIFCGDFFQLPPVHAFPLYDNGRPVDGDDALGRALWRSTLNAAVVLTENHRTKLDPAYGELLHVLREGTMDTATWRVALAALTDRWKFRTRSGAACWTALEEAAALRTQIAAVKDATTSSTAGREGENERTDDQDDADSGSNVVGKLVAESGKIAGRHTDNSNCEVQQEPYVITPRNVHRIAINRAFARRHIAAVNSSVPADASWRERGILLVDAVFYRYRPYERDPPRYSAQWQDTWRRLLTEKELGNKYAPVLRILFGKRYMLTQNHNLTRGVANGMWAIVRDVQLLPGAVPKWDRTEGAFRIDADQIKCFIVEYPDRDWGRIKHHPKLPNGHFIITPDTPESAPSGYKVFDTNVGGNVKKCRMTQLPIIQAHAVSGHKSQGQTLEHIIITKLYDVGIRGLVSMLNDLGWFYTAVSRTKTRGGLKLDVRALPTEHIKAWRLDVLAEMARLQVLHEETRIRVHTAGDQRTDAANRRRLQNARNEAAAAKKAFRQRTKK